ncbi:MAG: PAS domain S-box protein, partial [Bacteroidales bacterium]|nr:PAS domain S-box protein [Bacteroidales bacterium]
MSTEIRILIAEDLPSDASLAEREILKVLPAATFKRVETKEAFISALEEYQPDLIVSDYQMPSFDGLTALKITLEKAPVTPFIIHTGSMNEDTAVACMKAGATDYVIKEHMKRLGPAVKNALANKKIKLAHIKAHRALVESEERFRRLAENADDLIYRIDFVPERRFSYVSPSATRITGYTPEEHYADPDLGFKLVHPEDRKLLESMQHTVHDSIMSLTLRWQKKDGTVIWTEQKNVLIHDEEGKLQAIEGIARDITERKMAEAKLEKSEQMLTMAGKLAHLGGWSVDLIKNEMIWSDEVAAIHEMPAGFSPSVEEGINYYAPEYRERITKVYTDCVKDGVPYDEELQIITGKGRRVWVRAIGVPICDKSGKTVSINGAFQDISERKSAENALRESELKFRHLVQGGKDIIAMYDKQGRV